MPTSAPPPVDVAPLFDPARYAGRPALVTDTETWTYADLATAAAEVAAAWGPGRRFVVIAMHNDVPSLISYLAALHHGHVPLLLPGGRAEVTDDVLRHYRPDVICRGEERLVTSAVPEHELHDDLALLLSTSGSTGSPRLVRLSHENLRSNASAIAEFLGLTGEDRGITSLPLHYCYGLSVLHSHLVVGAAVALTSLSVVDDCFWDLARRAGVTSLAAVPHTIELLERSGFADRSLPTLRAVTQAGGRLAPERVRALAASGAAGGWDLHVMYGQTEATARIAHLPPHLAATHAAAVGIPIPGGSVRIDPVPGEPEGVGELVYTGPNVMLGYATSPADLARGRDLRELRTGDLARIRHGLIEIVGRASRRAKLYGLRLDLDRLEELLAAEGLPAHVVATERTLEAFTSDATRVAGTRSRLAALAGVPLATVRSQLLPAPPLTASGKVDRAALLDRAAIADLDPGAPRPAASQRSVREHIAVVLGRPDAGADDTFAGLGGDSLSYVEAATRLAPLFPHGLPARWHTMPLGELQRRAGRRHLPRASAATLWTRVETTIPVRAAAVLLILATHADLIDVQGGAHVLLVAAGFNFARFQLAAPGGSARVRHTIASIAQVVLPATLWIGAAGVLTGAYRPATAVFLNGVLGSDTWDDQWQFWFLEALVWTMLAALLVLAIPPVHRLERRAPLGVALAALALTGALRFALVGGVEAGPTQRYSVPVVACFFVLGWTAARAQHPLARLVVAVAAVALVAGFFGEPRRESIVVAGVLMLWVPVLPVPRLLLRPIATVASASLCIYLTQWQVYPALEAAGLPLLAVAASVAVGIGYAELARPVQRAAARLVRGAGAAAGSAAYQRRGPSRGHAPACR